MSNRSLARIWLISVSVPRPAYPWEKCLDRLSSSLLSLLRWEQPVVLLRRKHSSSAPSDRPTLHSGVGHTKDPAAQSGFSSPLWSMSKGKSSMCNPPPLIKHQVEGEGAQLQHLHQPPAPSSLMERRESWDNSLGSQTVWAVHVHWTKSFSKKCCLLKI